MTAKELQRIAARISNNTWCRHWLHWNWPRLEPHLMAIQARDFDGSLVALYSYDMEKLGFRRHETEPETWIIERTNEDGTPYKSDYP